MNLFMAVELVSSIASPNLVPRKAYCKQSLQQPLSHLDEGNDHDEKNWQDNPRMVENDCKNIVRFTGLLWLMRWESSCHETYPQ